MRARNRFWSSTNRTRGFASQPFPLDDKVRTVYAPVESRKTREGDRKTLAAGSPPPPHSRRDAGFCKAPRESSKTPDSSRRKLIHCRLQWHTPGWWQQQSAGLCRQTLDHFAFRYQPLTQPPMIHFCAEYVGIVPRNPCQMRPEAV